MRDFGRVAEPAPRGHSRDPAPVRLRSRCPRPSDFGRGAQLPVLMAHACACNVAIIEVCPRIAALVWPAF
eukprot:2651114-Alexandrium_andersonii.AAC.1